MFFIKRVSAIFRRKNKLLQAELDIERYKREIQRLNKIIYTSKFLPINLTEKIEIVSLKDKFTFNKKERIGARTTIESGLREAFITKLFELKLIQFSTLTEGDKVTTEALLRVIKPK